MTSGVREQVAEWNADIVVLEYDGYSSEAFSGTAVQLEGYTLHEREGGEVGRGEERGSIDDDNDDTEVSYIVGKPQSQ